LKITRVSLQSHEGADCLFLNWIASSEHCQGQCVSGGRGFRRLTALGLTTLVVLVFGGPISPVLALEGAAVGAARDRGLGDALRVLHCLDYSIASQKN